MIFINDKPVIKMDDEVGDIVEDVISDEVIL